MHYRRTEKELKRRQAERSLETIPTLNNRMGSEGLLLAFLWSSACSFSYRTDGDMLP